MASANLEVPGRALAVGAHPDDVEFGCGGTLAKWAASGCEILHVVCTDGSRGSWDPAQDPAELVTRRQEEQRAASIALGGRGEVVFLGWPDGELESGLRQRWQIAEAIRAFRPDVVLGHDPWRRYRLHPDHRNAGFLVTDGIVAARDPLFFPELRHGPHRPATLLLWEADEADHIEDVSSSFPTKLAALLEHRSQLRSTMHIDHDDIASPSGAAALEAFTERLRQHLSEAGANAGLELAEA
ncbi:MAG: family deacetylase, partial [Acidimicrobiaceae bacterium]|nr:family deacetylase [Acidimicrobiaceae bacterium]